ncbi:hypothetical protein D3C85_537640 [compost metagenome]
MSLEDFLQLIQSVLRCCDYLVWSLELAETSRQLLNLLRGFKLFFQLVEGIAVCRVLLTAFNESRVVKLDLLVLDLAIHQGRIELLDVGFQCVDGFLCLLDMLTELVDLDLLHTSWAFTIGAFVQNGFELQYRFVLYQLLFLFLLAERNGDSGFFTWNANGFTRFGCFCLALLKTLPLLANFVQFRQSLFLGLQVSIQRLEFLLELVNRLGLAEFFDLLHQLFLLGSEGLQLGLVFFHVAVPLTFFLCTLQVDRWLELLALGFQLLVLLNDSERGLVLLDLGLQSLRVTTEGANDLLGFFQFCRSFTRPGETFQQPVDFEQLGIQDVKLDLLVLDLTELLGEILFQLVVHI